jgi:glycogen synthase
VNAPRERESRRERERERGGRGGNTYKIIHHREQQQQQQNQQKRTHTHTLRERERDKRRHCIEIKYSRYVEKALRILIHDNKYKEQLLIFTMRFFSLKGRVTTFFSPQTSHSRDNTNKRTARFTFFGAVVIRERERPFVCLFVACVLSRYRARGGERERRERTKRKRWKGTR